jgi:CheY-like chemotaxis protein
MVYLLFDPVRVKEQALPAKNGDYAISLNQNHSAGVDDYLSKPIWPDKSKSPSLWALPLAFFSRQRRTGARGSGSALLSHL